MDIVPKTPSLIDDELNNLVGDIVFESLQNKFGFKKFRVYYILFIPVDVKSKNEDSVVEAFSNSLEECYVTHNFDLWKDEQWMK